MAESTSGRVFKNDASTYIPLKILNPYHLRASCQIQPDGTSTFGVIRNHKFVPITELRYRPTKSLASAIKRGIAKCATLGTTPPDGTGTPTATPTVPPSNSTEIPDVGVNAKLNGFLPFPSDNAWNSRVDDAPLEKTPPYYLYASSHLHPDFGGGPDSSGKVSIYGMPINVVADTTCPKVTLKFEIADESDAGPYPICASMAVENSWVSSDDGSDHHLLVYNRDNRKLYEIYNVKRSAAGAYSGYSGAIWDTTSNDERPLHWTSSDAAGLQVFPALLKYEEVAAGEVKHALRFTLQHTYAGFVEPARHAAGYSDPLLAPMGMRVRLKASVDISKLGPQAKVIAQAMKNYGMILADNGSNWFFQGTNDPRWDDDDLNGLKTLSGSDFEVLSMGKITAQ